MLGGARTLVMCRASGRDETVTNHSMSARIFAHAHRGTHIEANRPMHMALKAKRWTRAELARLPDDRNKYEVVRGELFVTPAPRAPHQQVIVVLARKLMHYVEAHALGDVLQARSVMVYDGSEVEPDIIVRPKAGPPPPPWESAPIPFLVVEVASDATRRRDRLAKRALYLDAGVAEYWMVDGDDRSVRVVRGDGSDELLRENLRWLPAGASAPFELDVAALFREALG